MVKRKSGKSSGRAKTHADYLSAQLRRDIVVERRLAGDTFAEIAEVVLEKFGADNLPRHWDRLYAYKDLKIVMDKHIKEMNLSIETHVLIQLARIEKLIQMLWNAIAPLEKGSKVRVTYIDRIERLMTRKARLLGLDSAIMLEHTGPDGGPIDFKLGAARDTIVGRLLQPAPFGDEDEKT